MIYPSYEESKDDPLSIYSYVKEAIRVRNSFPSITHGIVSVADDISLGRICAYTKEYQNEKVMIVLNIGEEPADVDLSAYGEFSALKAVLNTNEESITLKNASLHMPAYSIAVLGSE